MGGGGDSMARCKGNEMILVWCYLLTPSDHSMCRQPPSLPPYRMSTEVIKNNNDNSLHSLSIYYMVSSPLSALY